MTDIGDQKILQVECRNRLGELANPDAIQIWVRKPGDANGVLVNPIVHVSLGLYEALYSPVVAGEHIWRVETTGALTGAEERKFEVNEKEVPHA